MDLVGDLAARLDGVTFTDLTTEQVTARIIDEVVAWGRGHGWRVYRRPPSVVPLPPPLERQHSVIDVGGARGGGAAPVGGAGAGGPDRRAAAAGRDVPAPGPPPRPRLLTPAGPAGATARH